MFDLISQVLLDPQWSITYQIIIKLREEFIFWGHLHNLNDFCWRTVAWTVFPALFGPAFNLPDQLKSKFASPNDRHSFQSFRNLWTVHTILCKVGYKEAQATAGPFGETSLTAGEGVLRNWWGDHKIKVSSFGGISKFQVPHIGGITFWGIHF